MEITTLIPLSKSLSTMKLAPFIPVISLIHIAQARNEFKAVLPLTQFANPTFRVCIVEFIYALLIMEFPVKLILRCLACYALLHFFVLHLVSEERTLLVLMRLHHERRIEHSSSTAFAYIPYFNILIACLFIPVSIP